MRHVVIIETPGESNDTQGQPIKTWSTFATVHAAVEPLTGREYFAAAQINAETTTKITIRYQAGITQKMRVSYDSKIYNIDGIKNIGERDRQIELTCSEGVNDG
mgnify:CR=1 FL=1